MNTDQNKKCGSTNFLNFSDALNHLRWGERVARHHWKDAYSYLQVDYTGGPTPRIGWGQHKQPWMADGMELLAEDWYVL